MSRRQSRVSVDTRQNDTLFEFENFKKKFLLANKHITKLNSTLSVRIEELNAQISTLYVENLRLRASEIALAAQLKRERERSRKIITDAEAATHSLIKHFSHMRKSFNVPASRSSSEDSQPPPPALRAKKPVINPNQSPAPNRLARPPTFPGITEDDETDAIVDPDADELEASPTPIRRKKSKSRTSDPYSPFPALSSSLSVHDTHTLDLQDQLGKVGKRKPMRRQSGLLTTMTITKVTPDGITTDLVPPRPPSPAFGSPLRRSVGLEEEEEELAAMKGEPVDPQLDEHDMEAILPSVNKKERRTKEKERDREREREKDSTTDSGSTRETERKRSRVQDGSAAQESLQSTGKKSKLRDVTNSRATLSGTSIFDLPPDLDRHHTPEEDNQSIAESSRPTAAGRRFLTTPEPSAPPAHTSHLPTPRSSSPLPTHLPSELELIGGRERRVRKSVNYAEPKLNTKMRKPDPVPFTEKRLSTASSDRVSPEAPDALAPPEDGQKTIRRKKSRVHEIVKEDGEESEGTQADGEYNSLRWVNVDGRRRSVQGLTMRRTEGDDLRRHSMAV